MGAAPVMAIRRLTREEETPANRLGEHLDVGRRRAHGDVRVRPTRERVLAPFSALDPTWLARRITEDVAEESRGPPREPRLVPAFDLSRHPTTGLQHERRGPLGLPEVDDQRRRALDGPTLIAEDVLISQPERLVEVEHDLPQISHSQSGNRLLLRCRERRSELDRASFQDA